MEYDLVKQVLSLLPFFFFQQGRKGKDEQERNGGMRGRSTSLKSHFSG